MTDDVTFTGEPSLAHFVERLPVIVFRLDRQLRLVYVNKAVTRILGPQPDRSSSAEPRWKPG